MTDGELGSAAFAAGLLLGILVGLRWAREMFGGKSLPAPEEPIAPAPKGNVVPMVRLNRRRP